MFLDGLLNLGVSAGDDVNKVRLIRQVNGLNVFYTVVALSVGIICLIFLADTRGTFVLGIVQLAATCLYFANIIITAKKRLKVARYLTIYTFEWHLFIVAMLTNFWESPVLLVIVLYPLLAALVEVSIMRHLGVGMLQLGIYIFIHFHFKGVENVILQFSNINDFVADVLRVMGLTYFPVMGAVIMKIIFRENLRARETQKEMLNEISIANRQLEVYAEKLKDESQRLRAEVNIAREIQTMVLPSQEEIEKIEELDVACLMRPADEVGGDYYDIIKIDDLITIGIGDVTGHGLSSGIIMLMAQTAIRTLAEMRIRDSKEFLAVLNRVLYANIERIRAGKNMTLSIISYRDGEYVVSGQHESVIICRTDGTIENYDTLEYGFYVGLLPDISEQVNTFRLSLAPGDIMLLYSDGVTEAENSEGEQFGLERMCDVVNNSRELHPEKIKFKLIKMLYNFMGATEIYDDITFMVIKQC